VVFVAACVVVPVLANGVRAWGTVFVAQYVGPAVAGGIDHVIYGWFFFAAVIASTIAVGARFFDRPATAAMIDVVAIRANPWLARQGAAPRRTVAAALAVAAAMGGGWVAAADALVAAVPAAIVAPAVPGWRLEPVGGDWQPRADGAARRMLVRYRDAAGDRVDVFIAVWAVQRDGAKADGFGEGAWDPQSQWGWMGPAPVPAGYAPGEGVGDRLLGNGRVQRLAVTTYGHGDWSGGRAVSLRGAVFADRLRLRARATAVLIVSAVDAPGHPAAAAIAAFRAASGPAGAWLRRAGDGPQR
jgi:EpsI family protein